MEEIRPVDANQVNTGDGPAPPQPPSTAGRQAAVIVIVVLAVVGMLLSGKYLTRKSNGGPAIPTGNNLKGAVAPDFTLTSLDGKQVKLSDLRGKAVVLNFWATWCGPCKIEIPWLTDLQKQYQPQGVEIVGVAMDDDAEKKPDDIRKFTQEMNVNYQILLGNEKVADEYGGVDALPTTYYIDRDGKIVNRVFGIIGHKEIEQNIQAAMKKGAPATGNSGQ